MRRIAAAALAVTAIASGCGSKPAHPAAHATDPAQAVKQVARPSAKPKGVMLIFSGGAWLAPPKTEVASTRHYQQRYKELGWLAIDVGYRPGGQQSFADVTDAYDKAKAAHPGLPICAVGESSGGHLALMLATVRPLSCVEPVDAPSDLTTGLPKTLIQIAKAVFGNDLAKWSPLLQAQRIHGRVLIVQATGDQVVPAAQAKRLKAAVPGAQLVLFPGGNLPFIHATKIDRKAYRRYLLRERAWLPH